MEKWIPKFKQKSKTSRFSLKREQARKVKNIRSIKFFEFEADKKSVLE